MVLRKSYTHDYTGETFTAETYKCENLYTNKSATSFSNFYPVQTKQFLNDVYDTIIATGFEDVRKDEDKYIIEVFGIKFFCYLSYTSGNLYPKVLPYGYCSTSTYGITGWSTANTYSIQSSSNGNTHIGTLYDLQYNISVMTDDNGIHIFFGSYVSPSLDFYYLYVQKGKNLLDDSEIYACAPGLAGYILFLNKNLSPISGGSSNFLESPRSDFGLNSSYKYIVEPQLAYYGNFILYSMIRGNTKIFTSDNYYKIGTDIYFCERGYLYKVD